MAEAAHEVREVTFDCVAILLRRQGGRKLTEEMGCCERQNRPGEITRKDLVSLLRLLCGVCDSYTTLDQLNYSHAE